ncbi:perilipin-2-like [Phyllobates terribilis]|uniref:perilipin-2-like n=1 Tax=Phyllobates terribilis TaxID=111132 RepID=UPI003CCA87E9
MAERGENQTVSVVLRVARLPLVQSASQILSFAYQDVKSVHPLVEYVCDVSERGVRAVGGAAALGVSPILKLVEPQLAVMNGVALCVVDELEDRLPVLDEPADEVAADIHIKLVMGVSAVRTRAMGRAQDMINRTQTMVREVYEVTSLGMLSLGTLRAWEVVRLGAELAVSHAEELVDLYLPKQDEEGDARGLRSGGIEEADEESESGSVSRLWMLGGVVLTRCVSRLYSSLDQVFSFLHVALHLVYGVLTQLKRSSDTTPEALNISKEDPKQKDQVESSLVDAPNRRHSIHSPIGVSGLQFFSDDNHGFCDVSEPDRRCQSLYSSLSPSPIQED